MRDEVINKIINYGVNGLIGIFGSIVQYMYLITKGHVFSFTIFFAQVLMGGFVTIAVNEFIPQDRDMRIGLLFVAGFMSTKIVDFFASDKGFQLFMRKFVDKDFQRVEKEIEKPISEGPQI